MRTFLPGNFVYRNLNDTDDPSKGLTAKNPHADYLPDGHVDNGSKPTHRSQYISTTRSTEVATDPKHFRGRLVMIDLNKIQGSAIDVTTKENRKRVKPYGNWSGSAHGYAERSVEVLVTGYIPPEAIIWIGTPK